MKVAYSIIIVNYNGGLKLLECVDSVFRYTSDFELILVDNGSTDDSTSQISRKFPQIIILRNSDNIGFASANNMGIKRAMGKWLVLLNPDTRVTENWLDNLVNCATSSDQVGIVTPKLLRMDGKTIDSTGHTFDFRTGQAHDRGSGDIDAGQYEVVEEVPSCCFACVAIKREVIPQTGLLDDKMILYFEDVDYCIRTRIAGWKVFYCPASVVFHARGGLTSPTSAIRQNRAVAYRLRIILKCYNRSNAIKFGATRIGLDMVSMAAGIKNNDVRYFLSYLRSPIWNMANPPVSERRRVQHSRKLPDEDLRRSYLQ